jgi:hypothetical protein
VNETFQGANYAGFTTTAGAAKTRGGRIAKIVVLSAITGNITIYDNPTAASGPVLYASAANPPIGTILVIDIPAKFGMWVVPGSAGSFNVVYS